MRNAEYLGYSSRLKKDALKTISEHLFYVAKKEGLPIGAPVEYDAFTYEHQIPGGVLATLRWQLSQLRASTALMRCSKRWPR